MGFLVTFAPGSGYGIREVMQHTFAQKFILVVLAAALTAGAYVFVWKKIIIGAEQAVNAGYKTPAASATPAVKRRF